MSLNSLIDRQPWLKWAGLAVVLAVVLFVSLRLVQRDEQTQLGDSIKVTCKETGEVWDMRLARVELILLQRTFPLNPDEGLPNPKTNKLTGFPSNWESILQRVTAMHDAESSPAPPSPKPAH